MLYRFGSFITGLPKNIEIAINPNDANLKRSNVRIKIYKDGNAAASFSVAGIIKKAIEHPTNQLTQGETDLVTKFIATYRATVLQLVDSVISTSDFERIILQARGKI